MSVNFSAILSKPAGTGVEPVPLPVGNYPGVIRNWETGETSGQKTPFVRFNVQLTGWADTVDEEDRGSNDVTKKVMRKDYYLTDDALHRLDQFLVSMGADFSEGPSYEEVFATMPGTAVLAAVSQYVNKSTGKPANQIDNLHPAN